MIEFDNLDISHTFFSEVEELVKATDNNYIDVICTWCDRNCIELEVVAKIIQANPAWLAKLQIEGEKLHMVAKSGKKRLPL
jgi:hypothetical protein